ncbi:uncharacterized protein js isoform X1 [Euwallacea similis]|uniref:uncharacterized protein js isoform X1 n=1 Tax=Euwallacea similis TaxID=1736056 RepID=UPI00344EEFC3
MSSSAGWTWPTLVGLVLFGVLVRFSGVTGQKPSSFSCDGRTSGYYADVSAGCQVYHMCDGLGRQFSYRCPKNTLFQQRMLICDHWYMVNCSKAEEDYSANLLIGQRGRPFVEDLQFHRTPRPDLADPHVSQTETRITSNIIGADTEDSHTEYFLPSHWSTEISSQSTIPTSNKQEKNNNNFVKQSYYKTNYNTRDRVLIEAPRSNNGKVLNLNSINRDGTNTLNDNSKSAPSVNFPSGFKATTPVYPKEVNLDLSKFVNFQDPLSGDSNVQSVNFPSKFQATTPVYPKHVDTDPSRLSEFDFPVDADSDKRTVNFASKFKATTPVYPLRVEVDSSKLSEFDVSIPETKGNPENFSINFASNFRATTPVYPKTVDVNQSKFSGSEEQPPDQTTEDVIVNFSSDFKATTPVYPKHVDIDLSKFQEPVELPSEKSSLRINNTVNFGSSFKATTPVYPLSVEATSPIPEEFGLVPPKSSENDISVNFASKFQATTPVYPKSVEPTSPDPNSAGLQPPDQNFLKLNLEPPSFDTTFRRRSDDEDPSVVGNTFNSQQLNEFMVTIKPEQLKDLKQLWHIPEYDFPLESVVRPGYESEFSSFQARSPKLKSNNR